MAVVQEVEHIVQVGGSIAGSSRLILKVSLGKTLNPKLYILYQLECKCVNVGLKGC